MNDFEQKIAARDGKSFLANWKKELRQEQNNLKRAGFKIKGELGKGGRGIVFLVERDGREAAFKVFVYKEECEPQAKALEIWKGLAPNVIQRFSERSLLIEVLNNKDSLKRKYSLETGLFLLNKIGKASPESQGEALSAYHYFAARLERARFRNLKHGLYTLKEVSTIEKLFLGYREGKKQVIHGDFSPSNVIICQEPKVIDPRSFLWGEASVDGSKWILSRKRGKEIDFGINFFAERGFLKQELYFWMLVQAYDDSSAFASFPLADQRIETYASLTRKMIRFLA